MVKVPAPTPTKIYIRELPLSLSNCDGSKLSVSMFATALVGLVDSPGAVGSWLEFGLLSGGGHSLL